MLLVDANVSNDFKNVRRHYSLLDQTVSDVLNRNDMNDYDKIKLYQQALNKYIVNRDNIVTELDKPVKVQNVEASIETPPEAVAPPQVATTSHPKQVKRGPAVEAENIKRAKKASRSKSAVAATRSIDWDSYSSYTGRPARKRTVPRALNL